MSGLSLDMTISRPVQILMAVSFVVLIGLGGGLHFSRRQAEIRDDIRTAKKEYFEASAMAETYTTLKKSKDAKKVVLVGRLFPYVDTVVSSLKLTKVIDYVRPENRLQDDGSSIEVVHVAFKGITLDQFVRFLHNIEVKKREISIKAISIKKDGKRNLNTQMTLQKSG